MYLTLSPFRQAKQFNVTGLLVDSKKYLLYLQLSILNLKGSGNLPNEERELNYTVSLPYTWNIVYNCH